MQEPKRKYRWPYYAIAGVVLFIVLAFVWMSFLVKKIERERDFNAPIPTGVSTSTN